MAGPCVRREAGEDDVRPEGPDGPPHLAQDPLVAPDPQRFLRRLGEAEVHGGGEELLGSVDAPGGQQLLGADGREASAQLGADQVLAAAAPGEGEVGRAEVAPLGQGGQHGGVLVVRMGREVQDAAHGLEAVQLLLQVRGIADGNLGPEPGAQQHPHRQEDPDRGRGDLPRHRAGARRGRTQGSRERHGAPRSGRPAYRRVPASRRPRGRDRRLRLARGTALKFH